MHRPVLTLGIFTILALFCTALDAKADNYRKAVHAVRTNKLDRLKLFLPYMNEKQRTQLFIAAANYNKPKIIRYFLKRGVDPNVYSESGNTALIILSSKRELDIKIIRTLIKRGANINHGNNTETSGSCDTPLKEAVKSNNKELVTLLIKYGAKIDHQICNYDPTALQIAAEFNRLEIMEILLAHGADPNLTAGPKGKFNTLDKLLYDKQADKYSESQLTKVVSLLIDRGVKINSVALFGAARKGHAEALNLLLKSKRDTTLLNKLFWITKASGYKKAAAVLEKYGAVYVPDYYGKKTITDPESVDFALELRIRWNSLDKLNLQHVRELHDLVKTNLQTQPNRPVLWYLDSQIYCHFATWRSLELAPNTSAQRRNKIKDDAILNDYKKLCDASLEKALSLDKTAKLKQRLTRSMLISAGYFEHANPDLRVEALRRPLDGRRNMYEEKRLKGEFSGFEDEANYLHYKKTHYPYSAMISAYSQHSQYQKAIKLADKHIKLFPDRKSDLESRKWHFMHRYRVDPMLEAYNNGVPLLANKQEPIPEEFFDEIKLLELAPEGALKIVRKKGINTKINKNNETLINYLAAHLTVQRADPRIPYIILLINAGADLELVDINGRRPIHNAALRRNLIALYVLMQRDKEINVKDKSGTTPLLHAFSKIDFIKEEDNNLKVVELILKNGAEPNLSSGLGVVPIMRSYYPGMEKFLKLLLKYGADINSRDINGNTTFMRWVSGLGYGGKKATIIAKHLVKYGANIHTKNKKGVTPLMAAASSNRLEVVQYLLDKGADHSAKDNDGNTALERIKIANRKRLSHIEKRMKRMSDDKKSRYKKYIDEIKNLRKPIIKLLEDANDDW